MRPSLLLPFTLLCTNAFQIPFLDTELSLNDNKLINLITGKEDSKIHYKSIEEQLWPLDLNQYEDFQIIRIREHNKELAEYIRKHYQIWEISSDFIDFKISPQDLENLAHKFEFNYDIVIEDLSQSVFETYPSSKNETEDFLSSILTTSSTKMNTEEFNILSDIFFKEYRTLNTIYAWLDMVKETYPDYVDIEWIGQTFEGRDMKALHLHSNTGLNPDKKTIVITGGVHAREWISVSTALFTIFQLLTKYGGSKQETRYLNNLDFLIIPVFNPDGYDYTWTHDRLWRKNRQETYLPRCFGIDIDHSFGYHWTRSDDFPCGESYSGEVEFEAIEADNLNSYINITKNDHIIYGFLDFHSYTQKVLYPYAYSCDELPRDHENLVELAYGLSKSIRLKKGKNYEVLPACKDRGVDYLPGLGSGSSLDFMYHHRAHWAFQLKLRDTGSHGFLLPSTFISPVGKEIYASVKYFCQFILNPDL